MVVSNSFMDRNRDHGVSIVNSPNNTLQRQQIGRSGLHGVYIFGERASGNRIEEQQHHHRQQGLDGVNIAEASRNRITGNTIERNGNDGVELSGQGTTSSIVADNHDRQ